MAPSTRSLRWNFDLAVRQRNLLLFLALLPTLLLPACVGYAQTPGTPTTGPQQLLFAGLRASNSSPNSFYAQFNAVQADASGNLFLLLDQKDGIRLLKTDPTASNILAQVQLGAAGDTGLAMALDPSGNLYLTGAANSGSLSATSGTAFPGPSPGADNVFIGKFDQNLNEIFLTYAGTGRATVISIAATSDAVFLTGSVFGATLPVTPSAIIQAPASGSDQNGFVEKFNATGTTLLYATYLSGQSLNRQPNDTAPAAIVVDAGDHAYIAGYTTASGYPTLAAIIPDILSPTSGFLTKLTPGGDGILFSTFIPGPGISALALAPSPEDPAIQTILASGAISLGQFPIDSVPGPLVSTIYQTLLRLPLDGSGILSSTLLAPGIQSTLTSAPNSAIWLASNLTAPASLLPLTPLSTLGNSYALRVTQQNTATPQIDQTIRFGGLPSSNPNSASAPANITSLTTCPTGDPIFAGSISLTASGDLPTTETYDFPLYNAPTAALPSSLSAATLPPGSCSGSLCAGVAAFLAGLTPANPAPSLALSTGGFPNLVLRNLGSQAASNLQFTANGYTPASDCPSTFPAGGECNLILTGPGTLTMSASNTPAQTVSLPANTSPPNPIVFSPKELDFGVVTSSSPATRTITVTNLSSQPQPFASLSASNQTTPYTFAEYLSDCIPGGPSSKIILAGASCHITLTLTASSNASDDVFAESNWTIGSGNVLLTAYTQASDLNISATEIDFGTQFVNGIRLPRYLYLSNNSAAPVTHTPVALDPPFTLTDRCPTTLEPHTVCQLALAYNSTITPSADSTTLTLDDGISVLITGSTHPQPTGTGQSVNPNLSLTPASVTFPSAVPVTSTSSATLTVTVANTGTQPFALALGLSGDFTDSTNCPSTLPGNSTCSVVLTFAPSQPGTRQGLLSATAGSGTTPGYVDISGTGTAVLAAPNQTLSFGDVLLGQPSVLWYKITSSFSSLTAQSSALDFKAILVEDTGYGHGHPAPSAFQSTATGSCSNCWLGVQFTPSTTKPQTASLTLTSSGSGSPSPLTLTGTGLPLTGLVLTPVTQDFGSIPVHSSSAPTLFTLTNQTPNPANLSSPTVTGDFSLSTLPTGGSACNGPLAPNASCFVNMLFAPTATGQRTGTLTIPTSSTPITASLTGFGSPDPGLALNPAALVFHNVPGPSAAQQTITLTNTGTANLQLNATFTHTPNFSTSALSNCATLSPGASCTFNVIFTPTDALVTDTLLIDITSSTAGSVLYTVPLTGAYTTEDAGLQILPAQANFGPNPTGTLGLTRTFTINNLTAKSLALSLSLPRQFVLAGSTSVNTCAALAPYASCAFSATFLPLTNGDITGTIFAQAVPTDGSSTLNGLAYLEGYGNGPAALAIAGNLIPNPGQNLLNFGQVPSGQTAQQTLTLTNPSSSTPLTIRRLLSEWPFLVSSTTCGATLAPTQSCTATLTYTPLNQTSGSNPQPTPQPTSDTGTLIIESDAASAPDLIDLSGTAAPLTVASPANTAPLFAYASSTSSLTFASTQAGSASDPQIVTLSNTGTATLHIASLQASPDFTLENHCTTLVPSASCTILVTFTPLPSGSPQPEPRISALEITSDASSALDFISLYGIAQPSALTLTPLTLNFGAIQLGSSATLPLQVTNTGPATAFFTRTSIDNPSYAATGDCPAPNSPSGSSLAPGASCTLQISFTPTKTGGLPANLSLVTSLTPQGLIAPLTGSGIQSNLVASPASLNFQGIALGASAKLTLTLANTGSAPVSNLAFSLTGDYAITVPCPLTVLAPGQNCTLTVTFTPTATGLRNGTLTLSSSSSATTSIPLTGTGLSGGSFLLTVDGAASASASVKSEDPATYNLQLTPQNGFSGTVILNCTPITPGPYATCSLLPSTLTLNGAPLATIATLNTVTTSTPSSSTASNRGPHTPNPASSNLSRTLLCLLPAALLFFRNPRRGGSSATSGARHALPTLLAILLTACVFLLNGCGGSTINPNLRVTPPGTYQYQITATSTTGIEQSQTVTLNLTVTAP